MGVTMLVHFSRSQVAEVLQPLANLCTAFFLADAVNFCPVAGAYNDHFFNTTQSAQFLHSVCVIRTGDGELLANLERCGVMADSGNK